MKRRLRRAMQETLRHTFGLTNFRPGQKAAATCLLSGRDLLCILPTGAGKSLCWQLPAVVHPGLTVVISPLIALMHDQVGGLQRRGIAAVAINSLMTPQERIAAEMQIRTGDVRIVFVAPERLESPAFEKLMHDCRPWLLVVDEAHCVVQWGGEFRPVYNRIGSFVQRLPKRPVLCALTATADPPMRRQILRSLGMQRPKEIMLPVMRGNLIYNTLTTASANEAILKMMEKDPCKTVVFCRRRHRAERLAQELKRAGVKAAYYHAGLTRQERTAAQESFRAGDVEILAATSAFGMGVDIPDIRRVVHDGLPGSITDLAQQSGRAGRDGKPAECVVLVTPGDLMWNNYVYGGITGPFWILRVTHVWLARLRSWRSFRPVLKATMTAPCIPAAISAAFGQRAKACGRCSACLKGPVSRTEPPLRRRSEAGMRRWLLAWQLAPLAGRRGVKLRELLPVRQLRFISRTCCIPDGIEDAAVRSAVERMITSMRYWEEPAQGDGRE